jgi:hypothetical protein
MSLTVVAVGNKMTDYYADELQTIHPRTDKLFHGLLASRFILRILVFLRPYKQTVS